MLKFLFPLVLSIYMTVSLSPINTSTITTTEETEVLNKTNELKNEIKELKDAPSDSSYEKPAGFSTSYCYIGQWDRVTPFKIGNDVCKSDFLLGFKFSEKELSPSKSTEISSLTIPNINNKYSKLKFSYAIDDIAKDYSTDKKPSIHVIGYSEVLGYEKIASKNIERNGQIQTLELDIQKYTNLKIIVLPRVTTKTKFSKNYNSIYASSSGKKALQDYILLMDVQVK